MVRNFDLYRRLLGVQIRSQLQYRSSFIMDVIATGLITSLQFGTLAFIFQRFGNIAGWKLAEVAFLYGIVESGFGLMDMLFSGFDPGNFGRWTRLGRFDQLLLRPVSITLQVLASEFILRRLGRIFQGGLILFIAVRMLNIVWTWGKVFYLPVVILSVVFFFGGFFIIGATVSFWTLESIEIVNIFTYGGSEMMSYPMSIYQQWMRSFFTYIIPAIFISYYPSLFFLDKPDPFNMPWFTPFLSPLVGAGVLGLSLIFWRFGIRYYQSSGT